MASNIILQEKNGSAIVSRGNMVGKTYPLGGYLQASANGTIGVDLKEGSNFILKGVRFNYYKQASTAAFGATQGATVTALNALLDKRVLDDFIVKDDSNALSGTTKFRHKSGQSGADRDAGGTLELGLHSVSAGLYGSYLEITETDLSNTTGKSVAFGRLQGYLENQGTPNNWLDAQMQNGRADPLVTLKTYTVDWDNTGTIDISGSVDFSGSTKTIAFTAATSGIEYSDIDNTPAALDVAVAANTAKVTDNHYVFDQGIAATTWSINHALGKYPSVSVIDSAKTMVIGEVTYSDTNNLTIVFLAAFSGKAYLN